MSVVTQGMDRVQARLEKVEHADRLMNDPMERSTEYLYRTVEAGTPKDTGRLAGNLRKEVRPAGNGYVGAVYFEPTYGPYGHRYDQYVKSPELQAYMHRGRVPTIADDLERARPYIVEQFEDVPRLAVHG